MLLSIQTAMAQNEWIEDHLNGSGANLLIQANSFVLQYESYDGKKNKVRLSAKVYYQPKRDGDKTPIKHIVLSCHPTVTDNPATPTGSRPVDGDICRMAGIDERSCMVVCPDYCGYGLSTYLQHPYLIHDVTARNCVDGVVAAIEAAKKQGFEFDSNYTTQIVGYSQGGATALACTKYLEGDACPQSIKDKVKLSQTACGDGPYSAVATVKQYLKWGKPVKEEGETVYDQNLDYACVLPLIVAAAKDAYGDGCMHTVEIKDFFDPLFLESGILELIKTKGVDTGVLDNEINRVMKRQRPIDVFSEKIINKQTGEFNETTKEYKCLMRALELGDLTIGWEPKHPIYLYHLPADKTVPYVNTEEVFKKDHIGDLYPGLVKYVSPKDAHRSVPLLVLIKQDLTFPDYEHTNHAAGGTLFYVDYMFGDGLRTWPSGSSPGLFLNNKNKPLVID